MKQLARPKRALRLGAAGEAEKTFHISNIKETGVLVSLLEVFTTTLVCSNADGKQKIAIGIQDPQQEKPTVYVGRVKEFRQAFAGLVAIQKGSRRRGFVDPTSYEKARQAVALAMSFASTNSVPA